MTLTALGVEDWMYVQWESRISPRTPCSALQPLNCVGKRQAVTGMSVLGCINLLHLTLAWLSATGCESFVHSSVS